MRLLLAAALAAATWVALAPVVDCDCDFVNVDDPAYVSENPRTQQGLSRESLAWAFAPDTRVSANWHPLTLVSHMLDAELYGLEPRGHHRTSLLLHIANTVLLFLVLNAMTGSRWRSAAVAAVSGIHPLHVESVAWISERKDVLSTFFGLLTLAAYTRFGRASSRPAYAVACATYVCSLLAKPMLVTLPFVLLLLDYWPLRRLSLGAVGEAERALWRRRVVEKLPLLAVALAAVAFLVITLRTQRFIEYLAPFAALAAALAWHARRFHRTVPVGLAPVALVLSLLLAVFVGRHPIERLRNRISPFPDPVPEILGQIIPPGEQIVTCDWRLTGEMMLALPERRFVVALDPVFFHMKDPERYRIWFDTVRHPPERPALLLRDTFDARYVLCDHREKWRPFREALARDPDSALRGVVGFWRVYELRPRDLAVH